MSSPKRSTTLPTSYLWARIVREWMSGPEISYSAAPAHKTSCAVPPTIAPAMSSGAWMSEARRSMRKARLFSERASRPVMRNRDAVQETARTVARSLKASGTAAALTMATSMRSMTVKRLGAVDMSRRLVCTDTSTHCQ